METARISVTTLCLAALVLWPIPGFVKPPAASPNASADKAQDHGCGKGGREPHPHAGPESKRQDAEPKSRDCPGSEDRGPETDDPSNQESEMKSNEGKFVVAGVLLLAASGSASAAEIGFLAKDCRSSTGTPGASTPPQHTDPVSVPEVFCVTAGSLGKVCNPAPSVGGQSVPGQSVPGTPGGDQYCQLLSFVGASSASVLPYGSGCKSTQQAITVDRSGQGTWTFRVTKNGEEVFARSIDSPGSDGGVSPFPLEMCLGQ